MGSDTMTNQLKRNWNVYFIDEEIPQYIAIVINKETLNPNIISIIILNLVLFFNFLQEGKAMPSFNQHVFSQTIVLCLLDEELDSPQTKLDKGTHTLLKFPIFFSNFSLSLKKLITFCLYVLYWSQEGIIMRVALEFFIKSNSCTSTPFWWRLGLPPFCTRFPLLI